MANSDGSQTDESPLEEEEKPEKTTRRRKSKPVSTALPPAPSTTDISKVSGATSGIGVGTLFLFWAYNTPNENPYKPYIILVAPTITLGAAAIANVLTRLGKWILWETRHWYGVRQMKTTLEKCLKSNDISDEHKNELRKELEELHMYDVHTRKNAYKLNIIKSQ